MEIQSSLKRFALLTRVGLYLNNGSRQLGEDVISLPSLNGYVNDVGFKREIKKSKIYTIQLVFN